MRRNLLVTVVLIIAAPGIVVLAPHKASTPTFKESYLKGVRILRDCTGKTDYPHISKHVPGTVNVEATVKCPGREVSIDLTLTRITLKGTTSVHRSVLGNSKMTINVAMKCTWKKGAPYRYVASATYREAGGASAIHQTFADLEC